VRAAAAGESVISPELLARLLPRLQRQEPQPHDTLTDRETEVLMLLAEGLSNAAIAERLVVSVHTVRNHVANLSAKLGAHSKLEALSIAMREGLLPRG
jgi:DNA-binding NarL/FixJ family response regulator